MHCPKCGNESDFDQKFCRKCGLNLAPISSLVLVDSGRDDEQKPDKVERDKLILRRMVSWMIWGCVILLIGLVLLATGRAFDVPKFLSPLASFLLIGGTATAAYGVLAALREGIASPKELARPKGRDELSSSATNELSGEVPVGLPSVTERTTQLIGDDRKSEN